MWSGTPAWGWSGDCGVSRREAQPWASPQLCILVSWGNVPTLQKAPQGWHVRVSSRSQAVLGELSPWLQSCRREQTPTPGGCH